MAGVAIYSPVGGQAVTYPGYVEIGCDASFYISGGPNMTCQSNGTFDMTPTCVPKSAPNCTLPTIANAVGKVAGVVIYSPVGGQIITPLSFVEIGCDANFILSSGPNMTCQANGTFDITPSCVPMPVPNCTLPTIANAVGKVAGIAIYSPVGGQIITPLSYVEIGCGTSFALSGGPNMTCQANGTFDMTPTCVPVSAPNCTLPNISNAVGKVAGAVMYNSVGGQIITSHSSVEIACSTNFALSGGPNMTCQANGTFDMTPSCAPVPLTPPANCSLPAIPNSDGAVTSDGSSYPTVLAGQVTHGQYATIMCMLGYSHTGMNMTCNNGSFNHVVSCNREQRFRVIPVDTVWSLFSNELHASQHRQRSR